MSGTNSNQPDNQRPVRLGGPEGFCKTAGEVVSTERSEPVALATGSRSGVETSSPAAAPAASPLTAGQPLPGGEDAEPVAPSLSGRARGKRLVKPAEAPAGFGPEQSIRKKGIANFIGTSQRVGSIG